MNIKRTCSVLFGSAFLIFCAVASGSTNNKDYRNNDQLTLSVSDSDINKIVVSGDVITGIASPEGMISQSRNQDGSVYIRTHQESPFTVYVTTQHEHPFSALMVPKGEPGHTWILEPASKGSNKRAEEWEKNTPYSSLVVRVMKAITNDEIPKHFIRVPMDTNDEEGGLMVAGVKLTPDALWKGNSLVAIRYKMVNPSKKAINLEERQFFGSGVRAVAISDQMLSAGGVGFVYEILSANQESM